MGLRAFPADLSDGPLPCHSQTHKHTRNTHTLQSTSFLSLCVYVGGGAATEELCGGEEVVMISSLVTRVRYSGSQAFT